MTTHPDLIAVFGQLAQIWAEDGIGDGCPMCTRDEIAKINSILNKFGLTLSFESIEAGSFGPPYRIELHAL